MVIGHFVINHRCRPVGDELRITGGMLMKSVLAERLSLPTVCHFIPRLPKSPGMLTVLHLFVYVYS